MLVIPRGQLPGQNLIAQKCVCILLGRMAVNVQIILNSVFTGIRNVTRKVVGNREEVIQLAFRDYPLFHFVKQNDIRIAPIAKI